MNDSTILKSERLLLRPFIPEDLPNVFKGLSHPQVIPYYGVSYDSLEATKEQMEWFANLEKTKTGIWWAVCSLDNQTFYGAGGLNDWSQEHRKAEIGFWLLPEHWGKGIMSEAMPMIHRYAFEVMNIHRIEGFVETGNSICKKAVTKLGYSHEGTMVDSEMKNGRYISVDIYAKFG